MKKIVTLLVLVFSIALFAQDKKQERFERIKALKVAFLSDRLDLKPEEAEKFWPIYNQFEERQLEFHKQKRQLMHKLRPENTTGLSDKETATLMEQDDQLETEMQNNKRKLVKDLQGVIPNQKILMLKQLEIEFKEKLLRQMRHKKDKK
ncbi:sensor of ECF-type sigma factor [Flavobacterium sp.]|uniref:sensor of ECF-type sigma factor n=1 Tax=Flavobacterium sp. TaxID=239 RepID=UPI0028BDB040|nr:sensor of ECF-type sigma factor [Flavobacterium sp.]